MFRSTDRHPSDRLLMCAVDGELSTRRTAIVVAHLQQCDRCRARFAALAAVGDEIAHVCREALVPSTPRDGLRDRLRTQMTARATIWNRSRWFRFRKAVRTQPFTLRMGMSAAVLILMVHTIWLSYATVVRTRTPLELEAAALPIRTLTPGTIGPVSLDALCAGRPVEKPPVATALRDAVLRQYRMERVAAREYELDYLITPELGGVADARNLWPERYSTNVWNARVKDDLEELLPRLICRGQLDLATAQRDLAENWIAAYKKYFKTDRPMRQSVDLRDDDDDLRHPATIVARASVDDLSSYVFTVSRR
jgi:anti-sigma factor RsiW